LWGFEGATSRPTGAELVALQATTEGQAASYDKLLQLRPDQLQDLGAFNCAARPAKAGKKSAARVAKAEAGAAADAARAALAALAAALGFWRAADRDAIAAAQTTGQGVTEDHFDAMNGNSTHFDDVDPVERNAVLYRISQELSRDAIKDLCASDEKAIVKSLKAAGFQSPPLRKRQRLAPIFTLGGAPPKKAQAMAGGKKKPKQANKGAGRSSHKPMAACASKEALFLLGRAKREVDKQHESWPQGEAAPAGGHTAGTCEAGSKAPAAEAPAAEAPAAGAQAAEATAAGAQAAEATAAEMEKTGRDTSLASAGLNGCWTMGAMRRRIVENVNALATRTNNPEMAFDLAVTTNPLQKKQPMLGGKKLGSAWCWVRKFKKPLDLDGVRHTHVCFYCLWKNRFHWKRKVKQNGALLSWWDSAKEKVLNRTGNADNHLKTHANEPLFRSIKATCMAPADDLNCPATRKRKRMTGHFEKQFGADFVKKVGWDKLGKAEQEVHRTRLMRWMVRHNISYRAVQNADFKILIGGMIPGMPVFRRPTFLDLVDKDMSAFRRAIKTEMLAVIEEHGMAFLNWHHDIATSVNGHAVLGYTGRFWNVDGKLRSFPLGLIFLDHRSHSAAHTEDMCRKHFMREYGLDLRAVSASIGSDHTASAANVQRLAGNPGGANNGCDSHRCNTAMQYAIGMAENTKTVTKYDARGSKKKVRQITTPGGAFKPEWGTAPYALIKRLRARMQHFTASNPKKEELRVIREGVDAPTCTPHTDVITRFSSTVNTILSAVLLRVAMDVYFDAHPEFSDLKMTLADYDMLCELEGPLLLLTNHTMAMQANHLDLGGYVAILKIDLAAALAAGEFMLLDWKAKTTAATTRSSAPRRMVKVEHFRSRGAVHALTRLRLQLKLKLLDEMTDREWLLILLDPRTKLMFHNARFQASHGLVFIGACGVARGGCGGRALVQELCRYDPAIICKDASAKGVAPPRLGVASHRCHTRHIIVALLCMPHRPHRDSGLPRWGTGWRKPVPPRRSLRPALAPLLAPVRPHARTSWVSRPPTSTRQPVRS
jgi:hypothetical protein